jgi:hypothetical protein
MSINCEYELLPTVIDLDWFVLHFPLEARKLKTVTHDDDSQLQKQFEILYEHDIVTVIDLSDVSAEELNRLDMHPILTTCLLKYTSPITKRVQYLESKVKQLERVLLTNIQTMDAVDDKLF